MLHSVTIKSINTQMHAAKKLINPNPIISIATTSAPASANAAKTGNENSPNKNIIKMAIPVLTLPA